MEKDLEITFRNMESTPTLEADIRERVAKLEEFFDGIVACHVALEAPHRHQHRGKIYRVRIELKVPGDEIVVSRNPSENHAHEDAYVTIRDAFNAARRQLQDYVRRRRGHVKHHDVPLHGEIVELDLERGFGRIQTPDRRLIYFHRNAVINADFDRLETGVSVRYSEDMGEDGPRATTVHVEGKHHVVG